MPLRIWQLDPANLTPYYNVAICSALVQQGCQVRYITSRFLYDLNLVLPSGFETDYLYFKHLEHQWLLRYPRLRRVLRAFAYIWGHRRFLDQARTSRPDIVHIQWSRLPLIDLWLIQEIRALSIPVIHTVHDVVPLYAQDSSRKQLERVYQAANRLIVHSRANYNSFTETYPKVPVENLAIIPIINQGNATRPAGATREIARKRLGLPDGVPVALFFGTIKPYKGLDILIDAYRSVLQIQPNLHLIVAGTAEDARQAQILRTHERSFPNMVLHIGFIPDNELWQYHMAADFAILPYRHIYQSAALTTFMAYDLPVIVTDVGGLPEMVDGNGWVVPPDDPEALSNALLEAASDRMRLRAMGRRSSEILERCCSSARVGEALVALYQQVLQRNGG